MPAAGKGPDGGPLPGRKPSRTADRPSQPFLPKWRSKQRQGGHQGHCWDDNAVFLPSGDKARRLGGWLDPASACTSARNEGVSAPPTRALQFGETWTPGLSALDQTCLYSLVSVIASNDRRYRKPRWLWSLINTAGSGWGSGARVWGAGS